MLGGAAAVFVLFAFNSGYGYDQLEYLAIAREMAGGRSLYEFAPSKSPGIYVLLECLMRAGMGQTRFAVASLIGILVGLLAVMTWWAAARVLDRWRAGFCSLLVFPLAASSELNFLQPTVFVGASGLLAYALVHRTAHQHWVLHCCIAGAGIGLRILFKAVAGFYGVACVWWLLWLVWTRQLALRRAILAATSMALGLFMVLGIVAAWYAGKSEFEAAVYWTIDFLSWRTRPVLIFLKSRCSSCCGSCCQC